MNVVVLATGGLVAAAALAAWRKRVIGALPGRRLLLLSAAVVAALVVGTATDLSGVALTLPVLVVMAIEIVRSRWRAGDLALLAWVAASGTALGYQVAAAIEPDTGSFGDQGAMAMTALAVLSSAVAVISGRRLRRRP